MKKAVWWLIVVAGLALLAAIPYFSSLRHPAVTSAPRAADESPLSEPAPAPAHTEPAAPRHPLPALPPLEKPLPALDTSDTTLRNTVRELWSDQAVEERFQFRNFIRRVVATVDNLPRRKVAQQLMPVKRVDGSYLVEGDDSGYVATAANERRYGPYVALLDSIAPNKLVTLYVQLYPLFQQAYEDLGYPGQYFNDRLIVAIDDMLAAPELAAPPKLVRPKVFYVYADPELEEASAGQKILMRMGAGNAARVKTSLRAIRAELERQAASVPRAR